MTQHKKSWLVLFIFISLCVAGYVFFISQFESDELDGIAYGNGRIEATEVDVTSKYGGKLKKVLASEGELVASGQVLAELDSKELTAQLRRAEAEVNRAKQEHLFSMAIITQRKSELSLSQKDLSRSQGLYENANISLEQLQRDETAVETAKAALAAAQAQSLNALSSIEAAKANVELYKVQLDENKLTSPINGRILYRLAEPGEVLPPGGKVLTLLDPADMYITIFLPAKFAAQVAVGADAKIIIEGIDNSIPAIVSFVAPRAQFTPKEVETRTEREKLMFRVKVKISEDFLLNNGNWLKAGIPGEAYIKLNKNNPWPDFISKSNTQ